MSSNTQGNTHDELLGRHLNDCGLDALAELGFAGEDRDRAVRFDLDPRIEHGGRFEAAGKLRRRFGLCADVLPLGRRGAQRRRKREAHDQCPAACQKVAPLAIHVHPPFGRPRLAFMSPAARSTARRMRMCVPQRQRFVFMCRRISALEGAGFVSSSACARIIIPGMQ